MRHNIFIEHDASYFVVVPFRTYFVDLLCRDDVNISVSVLHRYCLPYYSKGFFSILAP